MYIYIYTYTLSVICIECVFVVTFPRYGHGADGQDTLIIIDYTDPRAESLGFKATGLHRCCRPVGCQRF